MGEALAKRRVERRPEFRGEREFGLFQRGLDVVDVELVRWNHADLFDVRIGHAQQASDDAIRVLLPRCDLLREGADRGVGLLKGVLASDAALILRSSGANELDAALTVHLADGLFDALLERVEHLGRGREVVVLLGRVLRERDRVAGADRNFAAAVRCIRVRVERIDHHE